MKVTNAEPTTIITMKKSQILMLVASLLFSFKAVSQTKNAKTMNNQLIQKFNVIGISVRTTNENGESAKEIEALWKKFWDEEIQKQIPNKVNDDIYAVYKDYETDFNGPYTLIIGLPVSSLENIPEDFIGSTIEKDRYKKFVSKGKMPEAVLATWMEIWQSKDLKRAYNADFTIHEKKYYEGEYAEVETFISVKE
jgi:predicted transcriptional regulator YdeE